MKCPKCQFENPEGAKYCNECGHSLAVTPQMPFPKDLSFDEKIANMQQYLPKGLPEKVLAQRHKIEGERKQVTVMFCDMERFTSLVERLGSEEAYAIMDQVYEILIHRVHEYDGTVNEMTGDGIMALFGAPIALEGAPQRALRSALSIHQEIARFNEQKRSQSSIPPVKMRVGIHTGPVVVGTLGNDLRVEFKAVGDTVNLASRMEGLAEPGTTYATEETFRLTEGLFRFEALGEKKVKGKEGSVAVYKLLSAKEDVYRSRLGAERMIYSEMVGRDNELDRLELQVMKAINGEGSIVNIIGEAGIGKSRLLAELKKRDVMKRVVLLEGRAISIGRNLSFHPIIDFLKRWARIREDDGEATAFDKLKTAVRSLYPEELGEVLPFVATLMGMKLSGRYAERVKGIEGEALEKLILKNVRELLIKATERTPLVIVVEDLHWADISSIELMESLFRLAETQRILFVNVSRPGHKETGDRIAETIKERLPVYYVEIVLDPLDERMSEALITNMLNISGFHHPVIGQIVRRAGGNPFFIEEVVRSFIDERAVVLKDGAFQVTEKIGTVAIPNTINDVLMARIDRLEETTRNLVKVASVIGRNFLYRILSEVAKPIEDIDKNLQYLKDVQLIRERKKIGEIEFVFNHGLTQEATYESILLRKRKELHLKIAGAIESVFAGNLNKFYGVLAYHYSNGENLERAEEYLIKAGEEALKSSASSEALSYYQEGLRLYLRKYGDAGDRDKLAMLEKNIGLAFFNKGQYAKAIEHFDSVLERWGEGSPKSKIIIAFKAICDLLNLITKLYLPSKKARKTPNKSDNEIFDLIQKRVISLIYLDPRRFFIETLMMLKKINEFDVTKIENGVSMYTGASALFSWTGISLRLSKKALEHAKNFINENDIKELFYYDLFDLIYNFLTGDWRNVREYDESLLDLNLRMGEFWQVSTYILFHTFIKIDKGAFREAEILIDKLSEIWEVYENEIAREYKHSMKTRLFMKSRKLYDAKVEADAGISFLSQTGRELSLLWHLGIKAIIRILLKDIDGAKQSLFKVKEILAKQEFVPPHYISSYLMGQLLFDLALLEKSILSNDKSGISEYREKACQSRKNALKNSGKYACNRTEVLRLVGLYYWLVDKQNKAVRWWHNSIKEAERLGARVELARTYMEIGKRLLEEKSRFRELSDIKAEGYLEKARLLFEELDLQWDLEELDKVVALNHS
jgi:class 3 adenylate cyclase